MRIAQLSPLHEAVPPQRYGGTERVLSWLTEELVRRGHEVTLFASGDSRTKAELVPVTPVALRPCGARETVGPHLRQLGLLRDRKSMSPREIWEALGVSKQGAMDLLNPLLETGLIERMGTRKSGRYVLRS